MTQQTTKRGRPRTTIDNPNLARRIHQTSAELRDTQTRAAELERQRNQLISEAVDDGWTHAQIASQTGLHRGRVGQIVAALRADQAG